MLVKGPDRFTRTLHMKDGLVYVQRKSLSNQGHTGIFINIHKKYQFNIDILDSSPP
jgi:hypothetical protein